MAAVQKLTDENSETDTTQSEVSVVYMYSERLLDLSDRFTKVADRARRTHALIEAYGLLKYMKIVEPVEASVQDLTTFHSDQYIACLESIGDDVDEDDSEEEWTEFGLGYDCPVKSGLFEYCTLIGGASIQAAQCLIDRQCNVAIHWTGGWHHAKKDEAAGFCYINDCVLAILKLRQCYSRVMYIDWDIHHGDGVEHAFLFTNKVMTVSFHKYSPGFYPGTGGICEVGEGRGLYYTVNVPIKDGINDSQYVSVVSGVLSAVYAAYKPDALVCQCGADCLTEDPMALSNITPQGLATCLNIVFNWKLPTLLLGGGGYNLVNTSRCWTYLTSVALSVNVDNDIPEHEYSDEYGPYFELKMGEGLKMNENTTESLLSVVNTIQDNLKNISQSPT